MFRIQNTAEELAHIHTLNKLLGDLVSTGTVTGLNTVRFPQSSVVLYDYLIASARPCSILIDQLGVAAVSKACGLTITFNNLEEFLATNPNVNPLLKSQHRVHVNYIEGLRNSEEGQSFETALVQSFVISGSSKISACDSHFIKQLQQNKPNDFALLCAYYGVKFSEQLILNFKFLNLNNTFNKMSLANQIKLTQRSDYYAGKAACGLDILAHAQQSEVTKKALLEKPIGWWSGLLSTHKTLYTEMLAQLPGLEEKLKPLISVNAKGQTCIARRDGTPIAVTKPVEQKRALVPSENQKDTKRQCTTSSPIASTASHHATLYGSSTTDSATSTSSMSSSSSSVATHFEATQSSPEIGPRIAIDSSDPWFDSTDALYSYLSSTESEKSRLTACISQPEMTASSHEWFGTDNPYTVKTEPAAVTNNPDDLTQTFGSVDTTEEELFIRIMGL